MPFRHFAWFNAETGRWIGEWAGHVPAPRIAGRVTGERRHLLLNDWQQAVQRLITPAGSPYPAADEVWDERAYDDCPDGGAVCLDVTSFAWPVGDHIWHRFDAVSLGLVWGPDHRFIQIDVERMEVDVNSQSSRPVRSTPSKCVIDITGTPLEALHGHLFGRLTREGRGWILAAAPRTTGALMPADDALAPLVTEALESARLELDLATVASADAIRVASPLGGTT